MTLVSVIVVLTIKSYTITAQDRPMNDVELEKISQYDLINKADTIRHKKMIDRFVKGIEGDEFVSGRFTHQGVIPNPDFECYERLERTATLEELEDLAQHENPVMRVYALNAASARDLKLDEELLEVLIADTTEVLIIDGVWSKEVRIADLAAHSQF